MRPCGRRRCAGVPDPVGDLPVLIDAPAIARWLVRFADLVERDRDRLTELDAAIGDADHGLNMARGLSAVRSRLAERGGPGATPAVLCREAALTLISTVGGASGPLYGTFLLRMGGALPASSSVEPEAFVASVRSGVDGVRGRGRAEPGDKTMLDAMLPAVEALEARGASSWSEAFGRAAAAAAAGSDATIPLVARKGRASYLGPRSVGHRDPGAASTVLMFEALASALADRSADPHVDPRSDRDA